ncbi:MAG: ATP-binding protein [Clostridia bacterium]|nr:ATP-binding protein [Clostridia bacterium]
MRELALNILDITENSVKAGAKLVEISIIAEGNLLTISIKDDGCGMDDEFLKKVTDPFTTTRTTRKVGMGVPLFKMAAEMAGGTFSIESTKNVGTKVIATFQIDNIDREPLGNMADTMVTLLSDDYATEYLLTVSVDGNQFSLDTRELKEQLGGISITEPQVLSFVREMINENIKEIGGTKL